MIPYGKQDIRKEDVNAIVDVLRSDWLTQGPTVPKFEKSVAEFCGASYAVAVNSATSALHLACRALGLGKGDLLWTSPNTFVASANCGLYCGARVDFVDIDPNTYNMSVNALRTKLELAEKTNTLPKIVIPVHFAGQSCEMRGIHALGQRYGFRIIEDASHAVGGKYLSDPIGNCRYSDISVFSFHPVKIITTGEGGMALTNDAKLHKQMESLRSHGITRNPAAMSGDSQGPWYYQQIGLGYNYRITDIQAALGLSQLNRLEQFINKRRRLAEYYDRMLADLSITLPWQHSDTASAWHLYVIRLSLDKIRKSRRQVFETLRSVGIGVHVHYIPVHTQPYYQQMGFNKGDFPKAEEYYEEALSLPMFPTLTKEQQEVVATNLERALS